MKTPKPKKVTVKIKEGKQKPKKVEITYIDIGKAEPINFDLSKLKPITHNAKIRHVLTGKEV